MMRRFLLGATFLALLAGCSTNRKTSLQLSGIEPNTIFTLEEKCGESYDCFSIVSPYMRRDSIESIKMPDDIRTICIENSIAREELATILFYKQSEVISYATVERIQIDFTSLSTSKRFPIDQQLTIDKNKQVTLK